MVAMDSCGKQVAVLSKMKRKSSTSYMLDADAGG